MKDYSLSRPDWLDTTRFDVNAKNPPEFRNIKDAAERQEQHRHMLRTLLAERFKLVVHRETRNLSAYALVVAKGGLKIQAVVGDGNSNLNTNNGNLTAKGITMEHSANWLSGRVDRPVVDQTEIKGIFNFSLEFSPEQRPTPAVPGESEHARDNTDSGPTLFTALQEQVGLRLQAHKLPVSIVVVDHMERTPTEN